MPNKYDSHLKCSFCGKSQEQVRKLIAGPGVYICDECDLCNEILDEELYDSGAAAPRAHNDLNLPNAVALARRSSRWDRFPNPLRLNTISMTMSSDKRRLKKFYPLPSITTTNASAPIKIKRRGMMWNCKNPTSSSLAQPEVVKPSWLKPWPTSWRFLCRCRRHNPHGSWLCRGRCGKYLTAPAASGRSRCGRSATGHYLYR